MPKAIKKRVEKKDRGEEGLGETVTDIRERFKERQRTLVYVLLISGAVILALGSFFVYNKVNTAKAQELEYQGYRLYYGIAQVQPVSPADRYKGALEKFRASYGAKKNPAVLLYVANCYYELGMYDDAINTLKALISRKNDPKVVALAYYKTAMAFEKKNDPASALDTLNKLAGVKDSPLQDMALVESAHIMELMGKPEEAKGKYKELVNKFPKSALAGEAKARLGS